MKRLIAVPVLVCLLLLPLSAAAQDQAAPSRPPYAPPIVREGDFAVRLAPALGLGNTDNESAAEDMLSSAGISPPFGWMADYPVTPKILGEVEEAAGRAVESGKLAMG